MSIDRLSKAARAAGYAMATSDDLLTSLSTAAKPGSDSWRAAEQHQELVMPRSAGQGEWRKGVYGLFGWGAPA